MDRGVEGVADDVLDTLELAKNVEALERRLIGEALSRAGGNRTQAAKLLGISRNGLAIKIERLGITPRLAPLWRRPLAERPAPSS